MFDRSINEPNKSAGFIQSSESLEGISLVDAMIEQAADEMARLEWPELRETELSEADVQKVRDVLKETKKRLPRRTKERLSRLSSEEQLALAQLLGKAIAYDMSVAEFLRAADEAREEIRRRLGLQRLMKTDQLLHLVHSVLSPELDPVVRETIQEMKRELRVARR